MGKRGTRLPHRLRSTAKGWLLMVLCLLPSISQGSGIDPHLRKYLYVELSQHQRAAIQPHEHLILYFSSLSYFRPGYTVNPDFIRALMLAESGGNCLAVSGKKALGLCQLLYPTAREAADEFLARGGRVRYVSSERLQTLKPADLFEPAVNILLTCYLVAKYNQVYEGRLDLVVAAWNAGQGSIRNGQPPKYPETMNLIGKVNGLLLALNKRGRAAQ